LTLFKPKHNFSQVIITLTFGTDGKTDGRTHGPFETTLCSLQRKHKQCSSTSRTRTQSDQLYKVRSSVNVTKTRSRAISRI